MGGFWKRTQSSPSPPQQLPLHNPLPSEDSEYLLATSSPAILKLPPEIVHHILAFLDVQSLVSLQRTCHYLRAQAGVEQLWIDLIKPNLPAHDFPHKPDPAPSYRELYLNHYPHWHLPRHKIWFSDEAFNGKLIIIKYETRRGSIEGYRLAAEMPPAIAQSWTYKPSVIIRHVEPRAYASTEDPVLSIPLALPVDSSSKSSRRAQIQGASGSGSSLCSDIRMQVGRPEQRINASLMLSKDLPLETANAPSVSVWPPRTIRSMPRTRSSNSSGDNFMSKGHKPQAINEVSQTTFRLRTWTQFTQGMLSFGVRIGEEISTWSTLHPALYTSTPEKPYQGIFIGDYANHGCEFLLVQQTERAPPRLQSRFTMADGDGGDDDGAGARHRSYIAAVLAALREQQFIDDEDEAAVTPQGVKNHSANTQVLQQNVPPNVPDPDGVIHTGALEAIKLTGDVHVPRGEHTFIADDIGPQGLVRIAGEAPFRGARVVRSRGHVANRGFHDGEYCASVKRTDVANEPADEYIPSQLFLIDQNTLAQYWIPFGHISYYHRVDIDELVLGASRDRRASS